MKGTVGVGTAGVISDGTTGTIGTGTAGALGPGMAGQGKTVAGTTGIVGNTGTMDSTGTTGSKAVAGGTGMAGADSSTNVNMNLEGVDREALAAICNATGLAISDPKCKFSFHHSTSTADMVTLRSI